MSEGNLSKFVSESIKLGKNITSSVVFAQAQIFGAIDTDIASESKASMISYTDTATSETKLSLVSESFPESFSNPLEVVCMPNSCLLTTIWKGGIYHTVVELCQEHWKITYCTTRTSEMVAAMMTHKSK